MQYTSTVCSPWQWLVDGDEPIFHQDSDMLKPARSESADSQMWSRLAQLEEMEAMEEVSKTLAHEESMFGHDHFMELDRDGDKSDESELDLIEQEALPDEESLSSPSSEPENYESSPSSESDAQAEDPAMQIDNL